MNSKERMHRRTLCEILFLFILFMFFIFSSSRVTIQSLFLHPSTRGIVIEIYDDEIMVIVEHWQGIRASALAYISLETRLGRAYVEVADRVRIFHTVDFIGEDESMPARLYQVLGIDLVYRPRKTVPQDVIPAEKLPEFS